MGRGRGKEDRIQEGLCGFPYNSGLCVFPHKNRLRSFARGSSRALSRGCGLVVSSFVYQRWTNLALFKLAFWFIFMLFCQLWVDEINIS